MSNQRTGELIYVPRPTRYGSTVFRSRLEARWAQVFDHLEIEWQYEPTGFLLDASWCPGLVECCPEPEFTEDRAYLPDFYLPQHDMWVEVKGAERTLRRGLAAWAAACLPSRLSDLPHSISNATTTRRDDAAWSLNGTGGKILLLGPVPLRDRTFTVLSPIVPHDSYASEVGDLFAYRVRLDALDERESWNYVTLHRRCDRHPWGVCSDCLTNKIVSVVQSDGHGETSVRCPNPVFNDDAFIEPWLNECDSKTWTTTGSGQPLDPSGDPDDTLREVWRAARGEVRCVRTTVNVALESARDAPDELHDTRFIERRRSALTPAPIRLSERWRQRQEIDRQMDLTVAEYERERDAADSVVGRSS
jgi:hypothetical protein